MTPDDGLGLDRSFRAEVVFEVTTPARFLFALAPALAGGSVDDEAFDVTGPNGSIPVETVAAPHGGRLHLHAGAPGLVTATFRSRFRPTGPSRIAVEPYEVFLYGRPSRYCPSDHLGGFAVAEFGTHGSALGRAGAIVEWIADRVVYLEGSSTVHDSAEDTLLTGAGTCRDFAHLGVALCRAVDIPARFTSVYAPGLSPMDFHAVFEVFDEDKWWLFDATHRAPRRAMTRIATGRDAADTAFVTVLEGAATFISLSVLATVDGLLPADDPTELLELP